MSALLSPKHSVYQHGDHGMKTTGVSHCWKLRDLGESLIQKLQRSRGTRLVIQNSGCPKGCWISLIKHLEFILEDRVKCKRWYPVSFPSCKLSVGHIERISPKLCCNLYNFAFKKVLPFVDSTAVQQFNHRCPLIPFWLTSATRVSFFSHHWLQLLAREGEKLPVSTFKRRNTNWWTARIVPLSCMYHNQGQPVHSIGSTVFQPF